MRTSLLQRFAVPALTLLWAVLFARITCLLLVTRRCRLLTWYLGAEVVVAASTILSYGFGFHYLQAFIYSGYLDDAANLTLVLLLVLALRARARPTWRGPLPLIVWLLAAVTTTALIVPHTTAGMNDGPLLVPRLIGHIAWSFMALVLAILPLYITLAGALPDTRLAGLLIGEGINVAFHGGLITVLLAHWTSSPQAFKSRVDLLYFLSLLIWCVTLVRRPRAVSRHNQLEF